MRFTTTRRRNDSGEAVTQLVIITPLLVLVVFLSVQAALYFHAANVAGAAAAQGAAAGSRVGAAAQDASSTAQLTVADLVSHTASAPAVAISGTDISVSVEIAISQIVPFFPSSVTRTATEPRERFVPEPDR